MASIGRVASTQKSLADVIADAAAAAPLAPTLELFNDTSGGQFSTSDGTVNVPNPPAGTTVEYLVASGPGATGTWSAVVPTFAADGTYIVFARLVNTAGEISELSNKLEFTLDTVPPGKPGVMLTFDGADGVVDGVTGRDGFTITGNAIDDVVEYSLDGTTWSSTAPNKLQNGDHTVHVRLADLAGNRSDETTLAFKVFKVTPDGPDNPHIVNDSGTSASDGITNVVPIIETDTPLTGATLQYRINGAGNWLDTLTAADFSGDGSYTITVRVLRDDGIASLATENVAFTLDTTAAKLVATLTNGTTSGGTTTVATTPVFSFQAREGTSAVAFSDDNGTTWRALGDLDQLSEGAHTLQFHQTDVAGNVSAASSAVTFTIGQGGTDPGTSGGGDVGGFGGSNDGPGGWDVGGIDFGGGSSDFGFF